MSADIAHHDREDRETPLPDDTRVVLERIRAEYIEMPGLSLKAGQVQRLCGVEPELCQIVLDLLVDEDFLRMRADGAFARRTDADIPRPRPAKATLESSRNATGDRCEKMQR